MIQKPYFSLLKATQVNRVHPRDVQPPALVRARNFIPSQSDLSLTLRPNIANYTDYVLKEMSAFQGVDDYLNTMVFSQKSANRSWINRCAPMEEAREVSLSSTYTTGTVTVLAATPTIVTGAGTLWLKNVWPHCWISVDDGSTYVRVKSVASDTSLETYTTPGTVSASAYIILRTHDYERANYPIHTESFVNSHIYNSCSPDTSDHSTTISGPFRSTLEKQTGSSSSGTAAASLWTAVPAQPVVTPGTPPTANYFFYDIFSDGASPEVIVAAGKDGSEAVLCTTTDGVTWTEVKRITGSNDSAFSRVVYSATGDGSGGPLWVAVGKKGYNSGLLCTSPDGTTWTEVSVPLAISSGYARKYGFTGLIRGGTKWVAVGYDYLFTSENGSTWTKRTIPADTHPIDVAYKATSTAYFTVVTDGSTVSYPSNINHRIMTSPDGATWTRVEADTFTSQYEMLSIVYDTSSSKWVAMSSLLGTTGAYVSSDATTWTAITGYSSNYQKDTRVVFNATAGYSVIFSNAEPDDYGSSTVMAKLSGTTLSAGTGYGYDDCGGVGYVDNKWMRVGYAAQTYISTNGTTWRPVFSTSSTYLRAATDVTATGYAGLAAFGKAGWMTRSTNYTTFLNSATGLDSSKDVYACYFGLVAAGIYKFVVAGKDGLLGVSGTGTSWSEKTSAATDDFYGLTRGMSGTDYMLVAVGEGGIIYTSIDQGANWVSQTSGVATDLNAVAWNGTNLFVAVGTGGVILSSPDGVTWTSRTSGTTQELRAVVWGGTTGKWVVLGDAIALYSTNGTSWSTSATTLTSILFNCVCTDATNYLAVGDDGELWSSANGTTWTERTSGVGYDLDACIYSNSTWYIFGDSNYVYSATALTAFTLAGVTQLDQPDIYDIFSHDVDETTLVGPGGNIYRISDGLLSRVDGAPIKDYNGVASDGTTWVVVGQYGFIYATTDFVTWTLATISDFSDKNSVTWDGTNFVCCGDVGVVAYSSDGITWDHVHTASSDNFNKVRYGNSRLVTVSDTGETYYSANNGAAWTAGIDLDTNLKDLACNTDLSRAAIAAQGLITVSGVPTNGEKLTVDTQEFTFVTTRTGAGEITKGATAAECVTNIVSAITADLATVTALDSTGNTVLVTAATPGAASESIVFTTDAGNLSLDGSGTLGGTRAGEDISHIWIAVSADGKVYRTDDLFTTATRIDNGSLGALSACIYTNGYYFVLAQNGSVWYASDTNAQAKTWAYTTPSQGGTFYGISWDGEKLYIAGAELQVYTNAFTFTAGTNLDSTLMEKFTPLSDLYRANVFATVDGYVILFGTYEFNSTTGEWEWQRRRLRWTAPGTYDDFATTGQAGSAEVYGEGNFVDARTLGHNVIVWESSNVAVISQTGVLEAPWEYRVIDWSNRIISNPIVVNGLAYWIEASGMLYQSNGDEVSAVPCGFDLTAWSDYDSASPVWLAYDETSGCIVIFQPVTSGTPVAYFYSPAMDVLTEVTIPKAAGTYWPKSIVGIGSGQGVPTLMVGYDTNPSTASTLSVGYFNYGNAITGCDTVGAVNARWYGEILTGFIQLVGPGEKTSLRALLAKTYQDKATVFYAFCGKGSDEDDWSGCHDTQGTISVTSTAVAGTSTMFSSLLGVSTGAETVYTGAVQPAWCWDVIVTNGSDVVQTTPSYTVTGAYEITFGSALTAGWKVYAYWDADPSPIMAVNDLIETDEGMHPIASITNRAALTLDWYPTTTLAGTHWHVDTPALGEKEAYAGFQLMADAVQVRIIVVPDSTVGTPETNAAKKVKLLGLEIHHQPAGKRPMVR